MESQRAAYIFCYYLSEAGPQRAFNSSAHTLCVCVYAAVYLFKAGLPTDCYDNTDNSNNKERGNRNGNGNRKSDRKDNACTA